MKLVRKTSGSVLAAAAATMFVSGCQYLPGGGSDAASAGTSHSTEVVHCMGVNSCKGTSSCKTATSACKGQNSCKGQGFVALDAEVCTQVGGTAG